MTLVPASLLGLAGILLIGVYLPQHNKIIERKLKRSDNYKNKIRAQAKHKLPLPRYSSI